MVNETSESMDHQETAVKSPLVEVKDLKKYFKVGDKHLKAVDHLNFDIYPGETVGLVGESGCGKSTAGRTMIRLYEATGGEVLFNGKNLFSLHQKELMKIRR